MAQDVAACIGLNGQHQAVDLAADHSSDGPVCKRQKARVPSRMGG
jgi:hypothetical protein